MHSYFEFRAQEIDPAPSFCLPLPLLLINLKDTIEDLGYFFSIQWEAINVKRNFSLMENLHKHAIYTVVSCN